MIIGLDIGTTSVSGVLADPVGRRVAASATRDNRSEIPSTRSWERTQSPEVILNTIQEVLGELTSVSPDPVRVIGVTGQMHGILYVDAEGAAISPLYTWQDQRGSLPTPEGGTYAQRLEALTGYPAAPGFGMVTHYYNVRNGLVPKEASALCTIADYAAARLGGCRRPVIDATQAAGLGLFDQGRLAFDAEAANKAGLDVRLLPEVVESGSGIGRTRDGVPVGCSIGDNQASFLGSVDDIRGTLLVNIGTGSQISAYSDYYLTGEGWETRPFPGGGCLLVGASLSGGKSYALLERLFRETCLLFGGTQPDREWVYEIMNRLADEPVDPDSRLRVNTRFYGTRENPAKRGSIDSLSADNLTAGHLVIGFLEGMVEELREFYEAFPPSVLERIVSITASGNGVRHNAALRRIVANRFGLMPSLSPYREEASLGAAICAWQAACANSDSR